MRWASLLLLVGCRQIFGIDDPHLLPDGPHTIDAAAIDARELDAALSDDWPCGTKPAAPTDLLESNNQNMTTLAITGFVFETTSSKFDVVAPGTATVVKFSYELHDTSCVAGCVDQIEIGFTPGSRSGCPFDGNVPKSTGVQGTVTFTLTAPAHAGLYAVPIAIGQNFGCMQDGAHSWFLGTPPANETVGYVCVH